MRFADVTNDVAFRKIFGKQDRKEVLISFLNAILDFAPERRITDVTIVDPYQLPKFPDGKATIIDVKAKDQEGKEYIVEMQVANALGFSKRVLYYTAQGYVSQINRGEFYTKLRPTIFIGILDFEISASPKYISRHQILNVETGERVLEDMEFTFIELPKFNTPREALGSLAEKWVFFIKEAEYLDLIPDDMDDPGLRSAFEEANIQTWSSDELKAYDYAGMRETENLMRIAKAEQDGLNKGLQKGLEQGIQKGIEQGIQKGIEQGIQKGIEQGIQKGIEQGKRNAQLDAARQMLRDGIDRERVKRYTSLTDSELDQL